MTLIINLHVAIEQTLYFAITLTIAVYFTNKIRKLRKKRTKDKTTKRRKLTKDK